MNALQFVDDKIIVNATLDKGRLNPKTVTWQDKTYTVISVGRQWSKGDTTHVLVELHTGSRMEIKMTPNFIWRLQRYWPAIFAV